MKIDVLTTFPNIFDSYMCESMMKEAQKKGKLQFFAHDLRDWTHDVHRTTDDYVYGGGDGLIMKCAPIFDAVDSLFAGDKPRTIIAAPQGEVLSDKLACELSKEDALLFICGHYEGLDERVYSLADDVISIGDYVLTSGELGVQVIVDAVVRKIPGVLGAENGAVNESFTQYLLEHPQYTRPDNFRGMEVPKVLLQGNHKKIAAFNREESIRRTWELRPDLIEMALRNNALDESDLKTLEKVKVQAARTEKHGV